SLFRAGTVGSDMRVTEHRIKAHGLPDLLLYDSLIDDGVLLQQDGSLLAAWSFRGPDMASATHAEMAALSARLNGILRLGSGWMIDGKAEKTGAAKHALTRFTAKVAAFEETFKTLVPVERLRIVAGNEQSVANPHRYDSLLRYLRRCVTGEDHPFALPEIPAFL